MAIRNVLIKVDFKAFGMHIGINLFCIAITGMKCRQNEYLIANRSI